MKNVTSLPLHIKYSFKVVRLFKLARLAYNFFCSSYFFIFLLSPSLWAQEPIKPALIKKVNLKAQVLISVDNFDTHYYVSDNVFYKRSPNQTISFNNLQLGELYDVNTFNPLKINVFYKDFNTVIVLDNRLAVVYKVDFNTLTPYRNIALVTTGYDNTLWLFNQDLRKLELFDFKTQSTRAQTVPVQSKVLDLISNYNYCWLLTEKFLYQYNYFGRLINKISNTGYTALKESNSNLFLKKGNTLFYLKENTDKMVPIETPNLLINQFSVTNETLYIYNNETLLEFQLKTN